MKQLSDPPFQRVFAACMRIKGYGDELSDPPFQRVFAA